MTNEETVMKEHLSFVKKLVANGGPQENEFDEVNERLNSIAAIIKNSDLLNEILKIIRDELGDALSPKTMQGQAYSKPYGYSGDFLVIENIYQKKVTTDVGLKNWDVFFHAQKAPIAVQNRKEYFKYYLSKIRQRFPEKAINILDIACGPCRDVIEFLEETNDSLIHFHCLDCDKYAIGYASKICGAYSDRITFYNNNVFRFKTDLQFDLIWSGGLFDYFTDKQFLYLTKNLYALLGKNGEFIIGNFHPDNPSKNYMEIFGDWYLNYRDEYQLIKLARDAGYCINDIRVGSEKECINYFLHIKKGESFL